jgi:hypothetical protein
MIVTRAFAILMGVAFLGLALQRGAGRDGSATESGAERQRQEQIRVFWTTYRRAGQERAAGRPAAAVPLYEKATALRPDHEDTLYYLGNSYFELGRYRDAAAAYSRLIDLNPIGSSRGYVQLALLHADRRAGSLSDLPMADRFFRKALEVDPDSGALLGIGEVALLRGDGKAARESLEGAHAENGMSVAAPYLLGYLCWREGERREAWDWFRLAVRRCAVKKPPIQWSEEGDLKADPELRWRALARQSVLGSYWLRLRRIESGRRTLRQDHMQREYERLRVALGAWVKDFRQLERRTAAAALAKRQAPGARGFQALPKRMVRRLRPA